ncbi:MAG: TraX family protein [Christensenellales bacterium]|jgi:hypothetical protein
MNFKILNRNALKILALITMLIDHIGFYFFPGQIVYRLVGRISFPLFAFFIAEGVFYTRNRKKYVALLFIFALISQPFYNLFFGVGELNILFTFLFSVFAIILIENLKNKNKTYLNYILLFALILFVLVLSLRGAVDYGFLGCALPVGFYFLRDHKLKFVFFVLSNALIALPVIIFNPLEFNSYMQLFATLAVPLLLMYSGENGKLNLKYLFYIFYPLHFILLYLIK